MFEDLLSYGKKSIKLLFRNPILFIPTLIQLGVMVLYLITLIPTFTGKSFHPSRGIGTMMIGGILIIIINILIESGKIFMIKQTVVNNGTTMEDFLKGIKRFTLRLILGALLTMAIFFVIGIILIPFMTILGFLRLGIVAAVLTFVLMMILGLFISMWEIILVYEDCTILEAFKGSIRFARNYFGTLLVINIIQAIFSGGNRGGFKWNSNDNNSINNQISLPLFMGIFGRLSVLLMVVGVIISTILQLFFDILYFQIYHDKRRNFI